MNLCPQHRGAVEFLGPAPHGGGEQADGEYAYFVMALVEGPVVALWCNARTGVGEHGLGARSPAG